MLLRTVKDVNTMIEDLDTLSDGVYKIGHGSFSELIVQYPIIDEEIRQARLSYDDKKSIQQFLLSKRIELRNIEKFKISISFEPSYEFIDKMYQWVNSYVKCNVVLDIEVNPDIVGGAEMSFRGFHKDCSFRAGLRKYFDSYKSVHELL